MRLQVLGSGSRGNAALLWVEDALLLLDAGLPIRTLAERLERARVGFRGLDHVIVSHGHLDHSRSAGIIAKRHGATLHAPERILEHRSIARAPARRGIVAGVPHAIDVGGNARLAVTAVAVPHDCDPTLAFRFETEGAALSYLTDMGEPRESVVGLLGNPDVLIIEANHDLELLQNGPYTDALKSRVSGTGGHLSNDQMATMLTRLVGPRLHTVVLAHLSEKNNRPELALAAAHDALARVGRGDVRVLAATQAIPTEIIDVHAPRP